MDAYAITTPDARAAILDLGAAKPADMTGLDEDDIDELCGKMKKLEAKRFRGAVEGLKAGGGASPGVAAAAPHVLSARGANWWDMFLSHVQAEGGDMTALLAEVLAGKALNVWYDKWGESCSPSLPSSSSKRPHNFLFALSAGQMRQAKPLQ